MDETHNALVRLSPNSRDIILTSQNPLDALGSINPEIGALAYAHKEQVLSPELLPYIVRFREYQSNEKIAIVDALVRRLGIERMAEVEKYRVDGAVDMTQISEENKTIRTGMREEGMTIRTGIEQAGMTRRTEIEMGGLVDIQRLKYEADVRAIEANLEAQKYLSDNQLRAVYAEAEAYKYSIEKISEVEKAVSKDRLEEAIRTAEIEFSAKIKQAEILRATYRDKNRAEVINNYVKNQTQLFLKLMQKQLQTEAIRARIVEAKENSKTQRYVSYQETIRAGISLLEKLIAAGHDNGEVIVEDGDKKMHLRYSSKKPEDNK